MTSPSEALSFYESAVFFMHRICYAKEITYLIRDQREREREKETDRQTDIETLSLDRTLDDNVPRR